MAFIWMWIKRILFFAAMLLSIVFAFSAFSENNGAMFVVFNILLMIFSLLSFVIYFKSEGEFSGLVFALLVIQLIISFCGVRALKIDSWLMVIVGSGVGLFINVGISGLLNFCRKIIDISDSIKNRCNAAMAIILRLAFIAGCIFGVLAVLGVFNK